MGSFQDERTLVDITLVEGNPMEDPEVSFIMCKIRASNRTCSMSWLRSRTSQPNMNRKIANETSRIPLQLMPSTKIGLVKSTTCICHYGQACSFFSPLHSRSVQVDFGKRSPCLEKK